MLRRTFLRSSIAALAIAPLAPTPGERLAAAARNQLGVTLTYDPRYTHLDYPNGDVPRSTGVCADVVIRAYRDALALDLQKLVHEDMQRDFAAYPRTWGVSHPDASIDHRRVLNLETFWTRAGARLWSASDAVAGDGFPRPHAPGDLFTWMLDARLPHVGIVVAASDNTTRVVHNIGGGVQKNDLTAFAPHRAKGHYRWAIA